MRWRRACGRIAVRALPPVLGIAVASPAASQFPPAPQARAEPAVWVSGGLGALHAESIADGRTQTAWNMEGYTTQWHAAIDVAVSRGFSLGLLGAYAQVPTNYVVTGADPAPPVSGDAPCLAAGACSATTNLVSLMVTGRLGGGRGLNQVLEFALGANQFRDIRSDDGARLAPERDTDLAGSVGYGFGYGFADDAQVALVYAFGFNAHQRDGLPGGANSLTQQRVTRLTVRFGFAERRAR